MLTFDRKLVGGLLAVSVLALAGGCSSSSPVELVANVPDTDAMTLLDAGPDEGGIALEEAASDASKPDSTVSDDESSPDGSASDGSPDGSTASTADASLDAGTADAGPSGPVLVESGSTLNIQGITNDGQVVYYDTSSQTYYAESIHGGSPTLIYAVPASSYYSYTREIANSVFVFDVGNDYISLVTLWSAALTQPVVLTSAGLSTYYSAVWASHDGRHIAYLQVTGDGTVGSLYGANADGSSPTLLVGDIVTSASASGRCFPLVTLGDRYAVASYCAVGDAGDTPAVEAFTVDAGWAHGAQVANAIFTRTAFGTPTNPFYFPYAFDPDGGSVVAASATSASGALQSFSVDGGSTILDPSVTMTSSLSIAGGAVGPGDAVYNTASGALKQAYTSSATPQTLVDGGVALFDAISSDGKWMLVSSGSNTRGLLDISAVSTVSPGPPLVVATTAQYGNLGMTLNTIPGDAFTADSKYAVVFTNLTQDSVGGTIFYARSMGVAAPYPGRLLSNGFAVDARPLTGSKVLVADNFQDSDGGAGSAPYVDFDVVDVSGNAPGTPLVTSVNADGNYAISADGTVVIYDVYSGAAPGIYAIAVP